MLRPLLALAALLVPTAAQAERFAIACEGLATFRHRQGGRMSPEQPPTPTRQIYVIDEEARTVHRALLPRQEFENLCAASMLCFPTFSPGLISIDNEASEPGSSFHSRLTLDRQSGRAEYRLEMEAGALHSEMHWAMTCERTEIPVFDPSRNRF